jgi:hypothetical protein
VAGVAAAGGFNDGQSFFDQSFGDLVGGDLVFDACPDFVGVDEGEGRHASVGPGAEEKSGFRSHSIAGALEAGMLAQIALEVVGEDGLEMAADVLAGKRGLDAVDGSHPGSDDAIGDTAGAVLVFRTFGFEEKRHLVGGSVIRDASDLIGESGVSQALPPDMLFVIFAIEESAIQEFGSTLCDLFVEKRIALFVERAGHFGQGAERADIDAGAHAVRPPELDVVSIVVWLKKRALVLRVPRSDAEIEAAFGVGVKAGEPFGVAADLPVAMEFKDSA